MKHFSIGDRHLSICSSPTLVWFPPSFLDRDLKSPVWAVDHFQVLGETSLVVVGFGDSLVIIARICLPTQELKGQFIFILLFMCIFTCVCAWRPDEGIGSSGAEIACSCELTGVGAGN